MWSRCPLLTALLLTALWGSEDPGGERRNPILFRQYGFLCLGFVLGGIKARNVKMEECALWASRTVCSLLRRRGQQDSEEASRVAGLRARWTSHLVSTVFLFQRN